MEATLEAIASALASHPWQILLGGIAVYYSVIDLLSVTGRSRRLTPRRRLPESRPLRQRLAA